MSQLSLQGIKNDYKELLTGTFLTKYATWLLILFGVCWIPIEGRVGFGIIKLSCMISAVVVLLLCAFSMTKALVWGIIYVSWQYFVSSLHPESFRSSTLYFSAGLTFTYVCFYNLLYVKEVMTIDRYLNLIKCFIVTYFAFCIMQQCCIVIGIRYAPVLNLTQFVDRGIGCNSLSMEPSTFARAMLVFYYAYVKCSEYIRGEGPFTPKELIRGKYKPYTLMFIWCMCTMGSGTAFVCLIAFCLYFVRKNNWYYIVPTFLFIYFFILPQVESEQLTRATSVINATSTLEQEAVEGADGSGASRISPVLNSLHVDIMDSATWLGHGIDYALKNNLVIRQEATLFDDYGLIFYIISMLFNLTCAYRLRSLGALFMLMGIGGGCGFNIHNSWWMMMIMTGVRYFYERRNDLEFEFDEDANEQD